jgi:hypothetical protein
MSDVSPVLEKRNTQICICDNQAARNRSTKAETSIVFRGPNLVALHVGFLPKHSRGQGWFYFKPLTGSRGRSWQRIRWNALSREDQKKVLDRVSRAPDYAKTPGKLKSKT